MLKTYSPLELIETLIRAHVSDRGRLPVKLRLSRQCLSLIQEEIQQYKRIGFPRTSYRLEKNGDETVLNGVPIEVSMSPSGPLLEVVSWRFGDDRMDATGYTTGIDPARPRSDRAFKSRWYRPR